MQNYEFPLVLTNFHPKKRKKRKRCEKESAKPRMRPGANLGWCLVLLNNYLGIIHEIEAGGQGDIGMAAYLLTVNQATVGGVDCYDAGLGNCNMDAACATNCLKRDGVNFHCFNG
jgi:hypothetical protein